MGASDETTGQAVVAFVIVKQSHRDEHTDDEFVTLLKAHVAQAIGAIARPRDIFIVTELPKTRSGKIMRRLLRSVARGDEITQDISTLENPAIVEQLRGKG